MMSGSIAPCKRLLIGVAGSIHSVQLPQYLIILKKEFAGEIRVLMTSMATQMCSPKSIQVYVDHQIETSLWGSPELKAPHIRAVRWADLFLVLPATANIIGKAANGIADDLLSTAIVAAEKPVVFAPAMNPSMWDNPAVQRNLTRLRDDGHYVIPPRPIISVTTEQFEEGLGPTPETVMPHLWHVCMRQRRQKYWPAATAEHPRSPALAPPRRTLALTRTARRASTATPASGVPERTLGDGPGTAGTPVGTAGAAGR
jgi:phosphopantothenoylcysteine decarboxylase / phosphopantothenate---cysteine ligase